MIDEAVGVGFKAIRDAFFAAAHDRCLGEGLREGSVCSQPAGWDGVEVALSDSAKVKIFAICGQGNAVLRSVSSMDEDEVAWSALLRRIRGMIVAGPPCSCIEVVPRRRP